MQFACGYFVMVCLVDCPCDSQTPVEELVVVPASAHVIFVEAHEADVVSRIGCAMTDTIYGCVCTNDPLPVDERHLFARQGADTFLFFHHLGKKLTVNVGRDGRFTLPRFVKAKSKKTFRCWAYPPRLATYLSARTIFFYWQ